MQNIEEIKARHAAEIKRLEGELQIAEAMPIAPDACQINASGAPWVSYRKRTMADAIAIFEAFAVMPVYVHKGTFTEIKPESMARADSSIERGPFAIWLTVDFNAGGGFGPSATLHFYAQVAGNPYQVNIGIEGPDYIGTCYALAPSPIEERDGRRRLVRRSYRGNSLLNGLADHHINWSYGAGGAIAEGARQDYLICADDDEIMPGGDHSHAIGQLRNIADALEPRGE